MSIKSLICGPVMHSKSVIVAWTLIWPILFLPLNAGESTLDKAQKIIQRSNKFTNHNKVTSEFVKKDFEVLKTPQSEVESVILFLSKLPQEDRQFLRFFTTYNIRSQVERENLILTLSFIIHSLVGIDPSTENAGIYAPLAYKNKDGKFIDVRRVPDSTTLWWIDLRDYSWSQESFEKISKINSYFFEPIVRHDTNGALRLLSANSVFRADWFVFYASQATSQDDIKLGFDFYSELLYSLNKKPQNEDEFQKIWGLDKNKARQFGNESGILITNISQTVSRRNRYLFRYRTDNGYFYETYDVLNSIGKRDYLSSLFLNNKIGRPPDVSDAGELIASNGLGLQVYALRDDKGKLVNFGDPGAVRHIQDVIGDVRVRVASGCMSCHSCGIIPARSVLVDFVESQAKLKLYDKNDINRLRRNLLSRRFEDSVSEDQALFEKSLFKTNGLDCKTNGQLFLQAISNYYRPVDLETAAFECGVLPEELIKKVKSNKYGFGAHTKMLVQLGEVIPREIWDSHGSDGIPGAFQETMIMLNGVTKIVDQTTVQESLDHIAKDVVTHTYSPTQQPVTNNKTKILRSIVPQELKTQSEVIDNLLEDQILNKLLEKEYNGQMWYYVVTSSGKKGYVKSSTVKESEISTEEFNKLFSSTQK